MTNRIIAGLCALACMMSLVACGSGSGAAGAADSDVAYIKDLASQCAAGKGFDYVEGDGKEIYPGYPEALDGTTYNIYTLRFQVGRKSAKTRDEKVWQLVHIAVPTDATCKSSLEDILEAPDTSSSTASTASTSGSGGGDA